MFPTERQQVILEGVQATGRADVNDLASRFEVTSETVRRDLSALEKQGTLRRVYGGAVLSDHSHVVPELGERADTMAAEKQWIATAAIAELPTAGSVAIDAGTTTAALAEAFPPVEALTVVTHALPLATALVRKPGVTVRMPGGRVRSETLAQVDECALRNLREIFVDVVFLATHGVSVENGMTTPDPAEAEVKRAMIAAARRVVLVSDHTKIGRTHFSRVAPVEECDVLITDRGIDDKVAREFKKAGVTVVRAGPHDAQSNEQ